MGKSSRRITKLCEEGRIEGATKVAGAWIMPIATQKTEDARIKNGKYVKK